MAEQYSEATVGGIEIELTTRGPEAQDGHPTGSDVLHAVLMESAKTRVEIDAEIEGIDVNGDDIVDELEVDDE